MSRIVAGIALIALANGVWAQNPPSATAAQKAAAPARKDTTPGFAINDQTVIQNCSRCHVRDSTGLMTPELVKGRNRERAPGSERRQSQTAPIPKCADPKRRKRQGRTERAPLSPFGIGGVRDWRRSGLAPFGIGAVSQLRRLGFCAATVCAIAVALLSSPLRAQGGGNATIYVGTYAKKILVLNESNLKVVDSIPISVGIPTSMTCATTPKNCARFSHVALR